MSQKDGAAERVAILLGVKYAHALRLVREVRTQMGDDLDFTDLAHGCRALKEKEEAEDKTPRRKRGVLRKGAGAVRCIPCKAEARADGEGSPIVLKHADDCPEKYPIKGHRYDAGSPRDDGEGCTYDLSNGALFLGAKTYDPCGRPLSEHAHSEYPEDGR